MLGMSPCLVACSLRRRAGSKRCVVALNDGLSIMGRAAVLACRLPANLRTTGFARSLSVSGGSGCRRAGKPAKAEDSPSLDRRCEAPLASPAWCEGRGSVAAPAPSASGDLGGNLAVDDRQFPMRGVEPAAAGSWRQECEVANGPTKRRSGHRVPACARRRCFGRRIELLLKPGRRRGQIRTIFEQRNPQAGNGDGRPGPPGSRCTRRTVGERLLVSKSRQ